MRSTNVEQKKYLIGKLNELKHQEEDLLASFNAASSDLETAKELERIERGRLLLAEAKSKDLRADIERLESVILNDAPSRLAASRAVSHRREREAREAHLYAEIRRDRRERVLLEELFRLQKEAEELMNGDIASLQQAVSSQDMLQQREVIRDEILCLRQCLVLEGGVTGRQGLDRLREAIRVAQETAARDAQMQENELVNVIDECAALEKRADRFRRERDDLLATLQSVSAATPRLLREIESRINTSPQKYTQSNIFDSTGGFTVSPPSLPPTFNQNTILNRNSETAGASRDWIHDALAAVRRGKEKATTTTDSLPSSSSSSSLNITTRGSSTGSRARALVARRILGRTGSTRTSSSPGKDRSALFSHHTNSSRARTKTPPQPASRISTSSPSLSKTRRSSIPPTPFELRPESSSFSTVSYDNEIHNSSVNDSTNAPVNAAIPALRTQRKERDEDEDDNDIPTPARQLAKDITSRAVTPHTARLIAAALAGVESPTTSISNSLRQSSPSSIRPGSLENNDISNMISSAEKQIFKSKRSNNEFVNPSELLFPMSSNETINQIQVESRDNKQSRGFESALWQSVFPTTSVAPSVALSSMQSSNIKTTPVLFAPHVHIVDTAINSNSTQQQNRIPKKHEVEKIRETAWGRRQGQKMLDAVVPLVSKQLIGSSFQRAPFLGQQTQNQPPLPRYQRRSQHQHHQQQQSQEQKYRQQQQRLVVPSTNSEARRILQELLQEHANDSLVPTSRSVSFADDVHFHSHTQSRSVSPRKVSHSPKEAVPHVTTPPGMRYAFGSLVKINPSIEARGDDSSRRSPKKDIDEIPPSWTERLSRPRIASPPRVQASESPILKVHNEFLSTMRSDVTPRGSTSLRNRLDNESSVQKNASVTSIAFKSPVNGAPPLSIREFFQRSGAISTKEDENDNIQNSTLTTRSAPPGAEELFEAALVKAIETAMNKHKGD
jgi:hypothetical protein